MLVKLNTPHADIMAAETFMAIIITTQPLTKGWPVEKLSFNK